MSLTCPPCTGSPGQFRDPRAGGHPADHGFFLISTAAIPARLTRTATDVRHAIRASARQRLLYAITIPAPSVVHPGALPWHVPTQTRPGIGEEVQVTAADLLVVVPWLAFAAGLAVIGWRLLASRRAHRRRHDHR
jgi:hypothetical protein